MVQGQLKIHSENILPIIKKWLYSEKDIFVRELVSNSCDAIQKVRILQNRGDVEAQNAEASSARIDITQDKEAMTLTFSDTGIGMTAEEVEKYLAQIAFSGAEEFVKAYQASDPFIGHFGLGFYSAYMVAQNVQVHTLSWQKDARPALWTCDGSCVYELSCGTRTVPGTDITLFLGPDNDEYMDEAKLAQIVKRYAAFLPYPIYLNGTLINSVEPLWVKPPQECEKNDYLKFFRTLYPMEPEPLFWIHLNVDYPFNLKGILYFPHIDKDFDFKKNHVKLFCNRVFVADDCKDILPDYLSMLKGVIDSPDIPLNVSRSYLQVDRTVKQLAAHISKKVADGLIALYKEEKERFFEAWKDVEVIVKFGIVQDEKFYQKAKEILVWKTSQGSWTTVEEYIERNQEKAPGIIFYTASEHEDSHLLKLYEDKGYEVICAPSPIDSTVMAFLERELKTTHFRRLDAEADHHILDHSREKTVLDEGGKTEASRIADFVRSTLADIPLEVSAKSLASSSVPALIVMNEDERRFRDYFMRVSGSTNKEPLQKMNFVVNTNSQLINSIYKLHSTQENLAKEMMRAVYDLALLSQKEMDAKDTSKFVNRSCELFEKIALHLTQK